MSLGQTQILHTPGETSYGATTTATNTPPPPPLSLHLPTSSLLSSALLSSPLSTLQPPPPLPNLFSKRVCPLLNCFLFHIISCHGDLISRIIWISLYLLIWEHFIFFIVFLSIFETNNHLICVSADYVRPSIEVGSCAGETNQWKNIIKLESTINQDMGDIPWLLKRSHQKIYTFSLRLCMCGGAVRRTHMCLGRYITIFQQIIYYGEFPYW